MRMDGSARPCTIATVYSLPTIQLSAKTMLSVFAAAAYAAGRSAAYTPYVMPTLEPCVAGFTIIGRPSFSTA
jgi:hypothetical protein